ncbi:hypothetical protein [Mesorhizobium sp. IMUNJ 23232]|uniref:hypothetical protein n=1 Tax=Mesorhizobium sp. IMUNJ 23232 TaxID=3376064 RepID=UPI0037A0DBB0
MIRLLALGLYLAAVIIGAVCVAASLPRTELEAIRDIKYGEALKAGDLVLPVDDNALAYLPKAVVKGEEVKDSDVIKLTGKELEAGKSPVSLVIDRRQVGGETIAVGESRAICDGKTVVVASVRILGSFCPAAGDNCLVVVELAEADAGKVKPKVGLMRQCK